MAVAAPKKQRSQSRKKILAKSISTKLNNALLPTLTKLLGKKKLEKRINKAAKLLVAGIKPVPAVKKKSSAPKKAAAKKKAVTLTSQSS